MVTPTPELNALVARARTGDARAFDEIVRRYQDRAVGYGAALLRGDFHGSEDAVQEAFLEAYRTLAALRCPEALPGWLRLLVRKHCDRRTRTPEARTRTVPLESAWGVAGPLDVAQTVAARESRAEVRAAIRTLPEGERAAVLLFYMGGQSLAETAAFLGVPVSVVKNRLYRARRRLKERMMDEMAETLQDQRPSNDDRLRDRVFVRLRDEYISQYHRDPGTADATLMEQARREFEAHLAGGPLDAEALYFGRSLYTGLSDYAALLDLVTRYRRENPSPSLSPSEEYWLRFEHVRSLGAVRRCEEAVAEQRAFVAWAMENVPGDPPIRITDPSYTASRALREAEEGDALPADALLPLVANIAEVSICFRELGLRDERAAMVRSLVNAAPKTRANRLYRFWALRSVVILFYGDPEGLAHAVAATEDIRALAGEDDDWEAPRWPIEATYMQMIAHHDAGDLATARARAEEATRLLEEYAARIDSGERRQAGSYRTLCDNVASPLADRGYDDLALRLFPAVLADNRGSGWAHVRCAACVWATTKDKARTLDLLRRAAPRELGSDLIDFFRSRPAFADVKDDPEFVAAITA